MNKKYLIMGLIALVAVGGTSAAILNTNNLSVVSTEVVSKSFTFDKDHQLNKDTEVDTDGQDMILIKTYSLQDGKYINIEGSGLGTDYETYTFDDSNAFIKSNEINKGTSSSSQTIIEFNIQGITSITWNISASQDYAGYGPYFNFGVTDKDNNNLATTTDITSSLTVTSGLSVNATLSMSSYKELNIVSITVNYNCVGPVS